MVIKSHTVLQTLGFKTTDRVVIIHADDVGMCEATVSAFADAAHFGLISSGAVMVPCPGFPQAAAYCRDHPDIDMGVHVTLNCEWDVSRWGPISTRAPASGLMDEEGCFYRRTDAVSEKADPKAVRAEMQAQLKRAQDAGIDVTHLDSHMFTALRPQFICDYVQMGLEQHLPTCIWPLDAPGWELNAGLGWRMRGWKDPHLLRFDHMACMPLHRPEARVIQAKRALDRLPSGLSLLLFHPAVDTPELRDIAHDWRCRVADYEALTSVELRAYVRSCGIYVLTYRALRDCLRGLNGTLEA